MGNRKKERTHPLEIIHPLPASNIYVSYEKKLIWPYFARSEIKSGFLEAYLERDSDTFPGLSVVYQNRDIFKEAKEFHKGEDDFPGIGLGIKEFWDTFRQRTNILLADPFFSAIQYRRMIAVLDEVLSSKDAMPEKNIYILGRNNIQKLIRYADIIKKEKIKIHELFKISIWRLCEKDIVHDRFAIMDGEIWHCGASICGMHAALNAVSRGWVDEEDKLMKFFMDTGEHIYG